MVSGRLPDWLCAKAVDSLLSVLLSRAKYDGGEAGIVDGIRELLCLKGH